MIFSMKTLYRCLLVCVAFFTFEILAIVPAYADVVIESTRIVYPSDRREVTIGVRNAGSAPALVQIWVDGKRGSKGQAEPAPFVVTPPLFRLDAQKGQRIRLFQTGAALPQDRESIFWFNLLDVPPKAKAAPETNLLQLAVRQRIKMFYRPQRLSGSAASAPAQIVWRLENRLGKWVIIADNPSPYFISLFGLDIGAAPKQTGINADMIAPFETASFSLPDRQLAFQQPVPIRYRFINDYGAVVRGESFASVTP